MGLRCTGATPTSRLPSSGWTRPASRCCGGSSSLRERAVTGSSLPGVRVKDWMLMFGVVAYEHARESDGVDSGTLARSTRATLREVV